MSPRIAGDDRSYKLRFCQGLKLADHEPCPSCGMPLGRYVEQAQVDDTSPLKTFVLQKFRKSVDHRFLLPTEFGEDWISISTVAHIIDKGGPLSGWAYNTALEGMLRLIADGVDINAIASHPDALDMLKATMKKKGFTPWVKKDRAASRGTEVHEVLERLSRGDDPSDVATFIANITIENFNDEEIREVQGYALAAAHFYLDKKPKVHLVERLVWSAKHRTSGTLDLLADRADMADMTVLTDLKTSKAVYEDHAVQTDGYAVCVNEMVDEGLLDVPRPTLHTIVLARSDGTYEEQVVPSDPQGFLAALELTRSVAKIAGVLKEAAEEREEAPLSGVDASTPPRDASSSAAPFAEGDAVQDHVSPGSEPSSSAPANDVPEEAPKGEAV